MRIKFLVSAASPTQSHRVGETYEIEDDEANRMIAAGFAELAEPADKPGKVTAVKAESAHKADKLPAAVQAVKAPSLKV